MYKQGNIEDNISNLIKVATLMLQKCYRFNLLLKDKIINTEIRRMEFADVVWKIATMK